MRHRANSRYSRYSTADLGQDPESVSLGSRSDDLAVLFMVGLVAKLGRSAGIDSNGWKLLPSAGLFFFFFFKATFGL